MQLYHFDRVANYGDALNPWLWPRFLGSRLQPRSPTLFLGIGTVLKTDLPAAERYAVLGAGGGYGPLPRPDARWRFYAVRGPLTAHALGLEPGLAALDGAYLLRRCVLPRPAAAARPRIGFMPHWQTRLRVPWARICAWSGLRYIDPALPVETALAELQACDGIIAEAMHAAITADALRIRWVPVRLGRHFLDFKWQDWLASITVDCPRLVLPAIQPVVGEAEAETGWRRGLRRAANSTAYALQTGALVARLRDLRRRCEGRERLGWLSPEATMVSRLDRLERALDRLRAAEN